MKRTELKRGKPLSKGTKPLKRETPLRQKRPTKQTGGPKRKHVRSRPGVYGPLHRWTRTLPCLLMGAECEGEITSHHVKTVGSGGVDEDNTTPLCLKHHRQVHRIGCETFQRRYAINLAEEATKVTELWRAEGEPDPRRMAA